MAHLQRLFYGTTSSIVVILFLLTTVLLSGVPSSAKADTTPVNNQEDPVIVDMAKDRKISTAEAKVRIGWQDKAEILHEKLIKQLPESDFGGMWIDKKTDRVKVGVLNETKSNGSKRAELAESVSDNELNWSPK